MIMKNDNDKDGDGDAGYGYDNCNDTRNNNQGSNLTFELNSHMASTCSGFTSHKRVSTSLGTSVQHKMKKMSKILLLSNVNKNCNIRKI